MLSSNLRSIRHLTSNIEEQQAVLALLLKYNLDLDKLVPLYTIGYSKDNKKYVWNYGYDILKLMEELTFARKRDVKNNQNSDREYYITAENIPLWKCIQAEHSVIGKDEIDLELVTSMLNDFENNNEDLK